MESLAEKYIRLSAISARERDDVCSQEEPPHQNSLNISVSFLIHFQERYLESYRKTSLLEAHISQVTRMNPECGRLVVVVASLHIIMLAKIRHGHPTEYTFREDIPPGFRNEAKYQTDFSNEISSRACEDIGTLRQMARSQSLPTLSGRAVVPCIYLRILKATATFLTSSKAPRFTLLFEQCLRNLRNEFCESDMQAKPLTRQGKYEIKYALKTELLISTKAVAGEHTEPT